jgi:flagellar hook assembly protein FlgD
VELKIYNTGGKLVRTLVNGHRQPGHYSALWNGLSDRGGPVASGVYYYRLKVGNKFKKTRKMTLLK